MTPEFCSWGRRIFTDQDRCLAIGTASVAIGKGEDLPVCRAHFGPALAQIESSGPPTNDPEPEPVTEVSNADTTR